MGERSKIVEGVVLLTQDGDNFGRWEFQMETLADREQALGVLNGTEQKPVPKIEALDPIPPWEKDKETKAAYISRTTADYTFNNRLKEMNEEENKKVREWEKKDALLRHVMASTVPKGKLDVLRQTEGKTAKAMWDEIKRSYQHQGFNETYSVYNTYHKIDSTEYNSATAFCEKFLSLKARLKELGKEPDEEAAVFHFLGALEASMPEYCRLRRMTFRDGESPKLLRLTNEVIDEARRNDPWKKAFATTGGGNSGPKGGGSGTKGGNSGSKGDSGNNNNKQSNKKKHFDKCDFCGRRHGETCYKQYPEKMSDAFKKKHPEAAAKYLEGAAKSNNLKPPVVSTAIEGRDDERERITIDTGANSHVFNSLKYFTKYLSINPPRGITTGGGEAYYEGVGTVELEVPQLDGTHRTWILRNVLYSPDFHINLISHSVIRKAGVWFHGESYSLIYEREVFTECVEIGGLPCLEVKQKEEVHVATHARHKDPHITDRRVTLQQLHEIFGHTNFGDLKSTISATKGLTLSDREKFDCDVCKQAKSRKDNSRLPRARAKQPFDHVHMDIVGPIKPTGPFGERYWILITDDCTRFRWVWILPNHVGVSIIIKQFQQKVRTQFGVKIKTYTCDSAKDFINKDFDAHLAESGSERLPSTAYTAHQNGPAERANGVVTQKGRAMTIDCNNPTLWTFATEYAVYLLNRTVSRILDGKTPYQALYEWAEAKDPIPNLRNLRQFGTAAWVHIDEARRVKGEKFAPRAWRGIFVGLEGSRIYRIWNQKTRRLIRSSSVQFSNSGIDEADGSDVEEDSVEEEERIEVYVPSSQKTTPTTVRGSKALPEDLPAEILTPAADKDDTLYEEMSTEDTAPCEDPLPSLGIPIDDLPSVQEVRPSPSTQPQPGPSNQLTQLSDRPRRPGTDRNVYKMNYSGYGERKYRSNAITVDNPPEEPVGYAVVRAFATAVSQPSQGYNLPPEPKTHKEALSHLYADKWLEAEEQELNKQTQKKTWRVINRRPAQRPLPTKWVYAYKWAADGSILSFKARLVVCGNQQEEDVWDTYSATARAPTIKILLALVTAADLECHQMDVVTAFLNGRLAPGEVVYIRLPDGTCAILDMALYGLRRASRLWYEEIATYLKQMGYKPLKADPCVFISKAKRHIIVVYVDDLILITYTTQEMEKLKQSLTSKYECKDLGPLHYYLGIRITRDRVNRQMDLSMESYIDKVATHYNRLTERRRKRPLDPTALDFKLRPKDDPAPAQLVQQYGSLIGKLLYPAVLIRADVAFAVGFLGRFVSNPTYPQYQAALGVLDYLYQHKDLRLRFEGNQSMEFSAFFNSEPRHDSCGLEAYSDSSFADSEDRKSTSGYAFRIAGGVVSHKSNKQRLVTTSTTEAEYVALTQAAKEASWIRQLLSELGYGARDAYPMKLYGDNQPSINLAHNNHHHNRTKHIDIYYHYIRQEVMGGRIVLLHVPTAEMVADGLTKPLSNEAHARFIDLLGLIHP